MKYSKLIETLKSLTRDEYRWFRDFLESSYFNKNKAVTILGKHLIRLAQQNFPPEKLVRERIHKLLFVDTPYREADFNHLMSKLLKCTEQFLVLREFEADETAQLNYALEATRKRQLHKNFATYHRQINKWQSLAQPKDYLRRYQMTKIAQQHFVDQEKRTEDPYLQETSDWLDLFYVSEKLKISCSMVARHRVTNESFRVGFITDSPVNWPFTSSEQALPSLYLASLRMLQTDGDTQILNEFITKVRSLASSLNIQETRELYNHAAFYCTQNIRKGRTDFTSILFNLYREGIEKGYLLDRGILSPWIYKNITKLGLGLKQFEWVQSFIETYSKHLPTEHQDDALNYNRADLHYYRGEYDEAMLLLHEVEFSDLFYKLGSKEMLVRIYFEKQETEALLAILNSFRIMLLREKRINQNIKSAYFNFLRLCREMYMLKITPNTVKQSKLRQKITEVNSLTSRKWLLEQIDK